MKKAENTKALTIGFICIATYLANFYLRHILSVLTPQLLDTGNYTIEHIGILSSVYMFFYAAGQLVNGFLGDFLSPKKMTVIGIGTAGIISIIFPFIGVNFLHIIFFAFFGFALSMVRGPLMKIISENTAPNKARIICVFFSFASFAGPLIASVLAMLKNWMATFVVAGVIALIMSVLAYIVFTIMENKKLISYKTTKGQGLASLFSVFKIEKFAFYMIIASVLEICTVSISFWIPTYLTDALGFAKNSANILYSGISFIRSFMPFVALIIFKLLKEKDILMLRSTFSITAILVAFMMLVDNRWLCLALLVIGLMSVSCSSAVLWSIYIPSLGKTGKVSSVNGVLDCTGYMVAALVNMLFASIMGNLGWNAVFTIWIGVELIGITATIFVNKKEKTEI